MTIPTIPDAVAQFAKDYPHVTKLPQDLEDEAKDAIKEACREFRKRNGFSEEELR